MYMDCDVTRFWKKVEKGQGCWLWIGQKDKDGYGRMKVNGKDFRATRFVWTFLNGPIPSGLLVCHRCDNPQCVNPEHLYTGTISDNAKDMLMRDRDHVKGDRNFFHVLQESQVREIYEIAATTNRSYPDIGKQYGVSGLAAQRICLGVSWKHLHLPKIDRSGPKNPDLPRVVRELRDHDHLPWKEIERKTCVSMTTLFKAYRLTGPYKVDK